MPITQQRMLQLLSAAQAYRDGLQQLMQRIRESEHRARKHPESVAQEFEQLCFTSLEALIIPNLAQHQTTVMLEQKHFAQNGRRNERKAKAQEQKRRAEGVPRAIYSPAPKSIAAPRTRVPQALPNPYEARAERPQSQMASQTPTPFVESLGGDDDIKELEAALAKASFGNERAQAIIAQVDAEAAQDSSNESDDEGEQLLP